ncbi:uncharacterized protein N7498_005679 [Penicillium cinerascens]|uniref:Uncharacterized protein n=1 Tax=Penicillium cinerascens TaxID=70096 RepID=A0A9W9T0V0_9EURO|nr:uncharacterized protein N7498_005679 [Penicillium cinerascens]KAJ5204800.1 hypothetical protein N7498_005679 [Penicillium cinerascens]
MGQRHNRRRTRPRHHYSSQETPATLTQAPNSPAIASSALSPPNIYAELSAFNQSAACLSSGSPAPVSLAPTWQYGYTAWQIPESAPQLESGGLDAARYRLFGGEPGDDLSLCYRMLEYFGGLDFIDSRRDCTLGD